MKKDSHSSFQSIPLNGQDFRVAIKNIPECVIGMDLEGKITIFNNAAEKLTGHTEKTVLGRKCSEVVRTSACEGGCLFAQSLAENKTISRHDVFLECEKGGSIPVCMNVTPIKDDEGNIIGVLETLIDRTEMQNLFRALEETNFLNENQKRRFEAVVKSIADGVVTFDADGKVTSLNLSAEKITGFDEGSALGKTFEGLFSVNLPGMNGEISKSLLRDDDVPPVEIEITAKDLNRIPVTMTVAVLRDKNGCVFGYVATFHDLSEIHELRRELKDRYEFSNIISKNHVMREIFKLIETVADSDASVLIQGESGTGKELIAHAIHNRSSRKDGAFVILNCGALTETLLESELFGHVKGAFSGAFKNKAGRFELAHGGTLFLDEVGDISPSMQVKLLRVLQTGKFERVGDTRTIEVDVRVISATNKNLAEEIVKGNFREDLYYRLNVVPLFLPPLRERKEDIPLLVRHFIKKYNRKNNRNVSEVSLNTMCMLMSYEWPGNVRELENAIECALVCSSGDVIHTDAIPIFKKGGGTMARHGAGERESAGEKERIIYALRGCKGNKSAASRALNMDRSTLWRKIKKYDIKESEFLSTDRA